MKAPLKVLKALSDPTRLRILSLLLRRDLCVCELMFVLRMEQSRVSHQLRILRDAELVEDRREGRWVNYGIPPASRPGLAHLLKRFLRLGPSDSEEVRDDLAGLKTCLAQDVRRRQGPVAQGGKKRP